MISKKKNLVKPAMFHDEIMGVKDCKTLYNYAVPAMYQNPQIHSSLNSDPYNAEMIQTSILNIFENRVRFSINNIISNMMHKLYKISSKADFHTGIGMLSTDILINDIQKQVPYLFELSFYYHIDPKNSELLKAVLMNAVSIIYNQLMDNLGYNADFGEEGSSVKEEIIQNANAIITGVCGEVFLELAKMAQGLITEAKGLYFEAGNLIIQNTIEASKPKGEYQTGYSDYKGDLIELGSMEDLEKSRISKNQLMNENDVSQSRFAGYTDDGKRIYTREVSSIAELKDAGLSNDEIKAMIPDDNQQNKLFIYELSDNVKEIQDSELEIANKNRNFAIAVPYVSSLYNILPSYDGEKIKYTLSNIRNLSRIDFVKYKNAGQDEEKLIDLDQLRKTGMSEVDIITYLYDVIDNFYN